MQVNIHIREQSGFDGTRQQRLEESIELLSRVLNSDAFKQDVEKRRFRRTQGHSSKKIYQLLMRGKETHQTDRDGEWDLYIHLYESDTSRNEIGHTKGAKSIHTNANWFDENTTAEYAGHLAHEYCHTLGFTHARWPLPRRSRTVPYAVGYIVRDLAKKVDLATDAS